MINSAGAVLTVAVKSQSKKCRQTMLSRCISGGADDISNLYPACRACNHYKSTYTVEKFRVVIQQAPALLMKSSATYRSLVRFGLIKHPGKTVVRFYFERQ